MVSSQQCMCIVLVCFLLILVFLKFFWDLDYELDYILDEDFAT